MSIDYFSLTKRFKKIKNAFRTKERSSHISARAAKLVSDFFTGKLKLSHVVVKGVSLYLRRQRHLYGDTALENSIDEIVAFISESGNATDFLFENKVLKKSNKYFVDFPRQVAYVFQNKGIYGLVQLIEENYTNISNYNKAIKLLEFSKILREEIKDVNASNDLVNIAVEFDTSIQTYRAVCRFFINNNETDFVFRTYAYIYVYQEKIMANDIIATDSLYLEFSKKYDLNLFEKYLLDNRSLIESKVEANGIRKFRNYIDEGNTENQGDVFLDMINKFGISEVLSFIESDMIAGNRDKAMMSLRAAKSIRDKANLGTTNQSAIEKLADYALSKDKSEGVLRNAYFCYQKVNAHEKSSKILELLRHIAGKNPTQRQRKIIWSGHDHLLTILDQVPLKPKEPYYKPRKGRVCYVIHNSLPHSSGGYATRGHGLLIGLLKRDIDIFAVTRPGYPHDISKISIDDINLVDEVDGVTYKRILYPSRRDYSNYEYMLKAAESYKKMFLEEKPQLVIAASNHLDGLPAMFAARSLGISFVYEIRGFWEVTRLSKYPEFEHNPMFEVEKELEAVVADNADHVFTLTQGMVDELNSRNVDTTDKITLLPNSCNVEKFNPQSRDLSLAKEINIPDHVSVIGYVGTLVSYEGLDDLAYACANLKKLGYEFRLLIVGNENASGQGKGSIVTQVQQIARDAGFLDWLIMPGRVPFEEVERYYSLIDIAPFPRKAWPVCEIVPPMKTLEALSMKKAVLVSSNKALTEMITHDVNGRVFERGNLEDLTDQLKYFLDHPEKWESYGEKGRVFVENERTWKQTAKKAEKVIVDLLY